jgi:dephospho-CoA kinase
VVPDGSAPPDPDQRHQPVASPHGDASPSVPFIGLTGAIAAGKSEALGAFARLGAATLSTDELAHDLLDDAEMRTRLAERWGDEVVVNGRVDRDRVGEIVFGSPEELAWLESVLHPLVGLRVAGWRSELPPDTALAVVEVPLLFEAGLEGAFDATVCVIAADETRARRAGERGTELLEGRSDRQLSQDEKAARATHVIRNDGSLEELERRLELLLPALTGIRGTA